MMSLNQNNNMRVITFTLGLLLFNIISVLAQSANDYFNRAANEYIYDGDQVALNTIDNGLKTYPDDQPLINLKDKILKEKQQQDQKDKQNQQDQEQQEQQQDQEQQQQNQQEQQDQQEQQEQDQQEQQQQNDDQQESEQGEDAEEKDQSQQAQEQETDEEGQEMQEPPKSRAEKLEDLNLTEEKARMILEAMKNNEIQYIQQNKRQPTKKPDSNKPDW